MSEAVAFLHALAHALATMTLYSPGHPAARRASENAWEALTALFAKDQHPIFIFLGGAPVYKGRAIQEMRGWVWSARLSDVGIQRLEFDKSVTVDGFAEGIGRVMTRITENLHEDPPDQTPIPGVLFGAVVITEDVLLDEGEATRIVEGSREIQLSLTDELEAMNYLIGEARKGRVARGEAESIVRILGGLLAEHALPQAIAPEDFAQYPAVHAINTALLSMAAGGVSSLDRPARHRLGVAALLHDIGMARLPIGIGEQGSLSVQDRALVESHTIEGARLLLGDGGRGLELAGLVAFEHHLRPDGTGYPQRRFRPLVHWASRLVGTAAAYVALRSPRPFRAPWAPERTVAHLESGAGTVFDPEAARLLAGIVRLA